jgi:hypothetical protein
MSVAALCFGLLLLGGCQRGWIPTPGAEQSRTGAGSDDALRRLELRLDQLERRLEDESRGAAPKDARTPAGPLQSLTLRIGSDDDRLRLYWADGQRSDLSCSKEGTGVWACG